ncbi:hypothetical protein KC963_00970 [Candidatus Saccharibacteria bacterium]|nr:hypothetical protein [Candidatus Saccharibacteria bacterium]
MKKLLIIGLVVLAVAAGVWWFVLRGDSSNDTQASQDADTSIPQAYKATDDVSFDSYTSEFNPNLKLRYPSSWIVAEGEANTADFQVITLESGQDLNGFYMCMNMDDYAADDKSDLSIPDIQVVAVEPFKTEGIKDGLYLVTFKRTKYPNDYQFGLTDVAPEVGANVFTDQITSDSGRRLQVWGRFNCRETERPSMTQEQFDNSQLFHEAKSVLASLQF